MQQTRGQTFWASGFWKTKIRSTPRIPLLVILLLRSLRQGPKARSPWLGARMAKEKGKLYTSLTGGKDMYSRSKTEHAQQKVVLFGRMEWREEPKKAEGLIAFYSFN